jgi:predicted metal-dependent peptidase
MKAEDKISKAKVFLVTQRPFWASCMMGLNVTETNDIPTMATDGNSIFWNRTFVDAITPKKLVGVFAHEVAHVFLLHCLRFKPDYDKDTWNIACDIAINDMLIRNGFTLPEGGIFGSQYNKYRDMSAEKIYGLLSKDGGDGDGDNSGKKPDTPTWGQVMPTKDKDGKELSAKEKDVIQASLESKLIQAVEGNGKIAGDIPNDFQELVDKIRKPQVDWREKLDRVLNGDNPEDFTWRKPQKNMWHNEGIYMPSVEKKGVGDLIIACDTSASNWSARKIILAEVNRISEDIKPNSITIIQCDTIVKDVKRYDKGEVIDQFVSRGNGGTRVQPVFNYVNDKELPCDHLIFFTDLEVNDFPKNPPQEYPITWVSSGMDKAPFGEVIWVDIHKYV